MSSCTHLGFARVPAFLRSHTAVVGVACAPVSLWSGSHSWGLSAASSCWLPGPQPLRLAAWDLAVAHLGLLGT